MAAPNLIESLSDPDLIKEERGVRRARIERPRWNPKEWHPVYEEVVMLDVLGYKGTEIAELKGFTPQHVYNILGTDNAKKIREIVVIRMRQKNEASIEERMETLQNKAMSRMEDVINDDNIFEKSPLGVFDRALAVLKGTGKIKPDAGVTNNTNVTMITDASLDKLQKAIEKSDMARALHLPSGVEVHTHDDGE